MNEKLMKAPLSRDPVDLTPVDLTQYVNAKEIAKILGKRPVEEGGTGVELTPRRIRYLASRDRILGARRDFSRPGHPWLFPIDAFLVREPGALAHRVSHPEEGSGWLSPLQLAEREGVRQRTVYKWLSRKKLAGAMWVDEEGWRIPEDVVAPEVRKGT